MRVKGVKELCSAIDYAFLKPYEGLSEFTQFLQKARVFPFRAICVPTSLAKRAIEEGFSGRVVCVIDFPFGFSTTGAKITALEEMLNLGVKDFDVVLNLIFLRGREVATLTKELRNLRQAARGAVLKGIIESPLLSPEEVKLAVGLLVDAGFDFVKTSTGFSGKATSLDEVKLIKNLAGDRIKVKASGGIRALDQALSFISAGADLIGTSSGYEIVMELKKREEGEEVEVYVDGACLGNPGPGGFAALIKLRDREEVLTGGEPHTTNNRMELRAFIAALSYFKQPKKLRVYTDSEYLLKGAMEWLPKWKANSFKTSDGTPVKNRDLWEKVDELLRFHSVTFKKVKAHSGHRENELVDSLAKEEALKWPRIHS